MVDIQLVQAFSSLGLVDLWVVANSMFDGWCRIFRRFANHMASQSDGVYCLPASVNYQIQVGGFKALIKMSPFGHPFYKSDWK